MLNRTIWYALGALLVCAGVSACGQLVATEDPIQVSLSESSPPSEASMESEPEQSETVEYVPKTELYTKKDYRRLDPAETEAAQTTLSVEQAWQLLDQMRDDDELIYSFEDAVLVDDTIYYVFQREMTEGYLKREGFNEVVQLTTFNFGKFAVNSANGEMHLALGGDEDAGTILLGPVLPNRIPPPSMTYEEAKQILFDRLGLNDVGCIYFLTYVNEDTKGFWGLNKYETKYYYMGLMAHRQELHTLYFLDIETKQVYYKEFKTIDGEFVSELAPIPDDHMAKDARLAMESGQELVQ